eukprot:TRINITY_DN9449_c0_g1_i1.p1 TRINITY_DN9449_c0_g1~~TRINITY_DN9449_c0_g1_i1.p1  ORF type:complete len:213 (+),score=87.36 TRINITY_DN9449_c0_g1_i1:26-640(+)
MCIRDRYMGVINLQMGCRNGVPSDEELKRVEDLYKEWEVKKKAPMNARVGELVNHALMVMKDKEKLDAFEPQAAELQKEVDIVDAEGKRIKDILEDIKLRRKQAKKAEKKKKAEKEKKAADEAEANKKKKEEEEKKKSLDPNIITERPLLSPEKKNNGIAEEQTSAKKIEGLENNPVSKSEVVLNVGPVPAEPESQKLLPPPAQ